MVLLDSLKILMNCVFCNCFSGWGNVIIDMMKKVVVFNNSDYSMLCNSGLIFVILNNVLGCKILMFSGLFWKICLDINFDLKDGRKSVYV